MKKENTPGESASVLTGQPANVRILTSRILEFADSGVPRAQFLKELARIMINSTGCDIVRLVLSDQGRCYRCELTRDITKPFRFDVMPSVLGGQGEVTWTSGPNDALERLCCDIVGKNTD